MATDLPEDVTTPLWRLRHARDRRAAVRPFIGQRVKLERWWGRVAALGDQTYEGVVLAVALSTVGNSSDMVILRTDNDTAWAISLAQVASIRAVKARRP